MSLHPCCARIYNNRARPCSPIPPLSVPLSSVAYVFTDSRGLHILKLPVFNHSERYSSYQCVGGTSQLAGSHAGPSALLLLNRVVFIEPVVARHVLRKPGIAFPRKSNYLSICISASSGRYLHGNTWRRRAWRFTATVFRKWVHAVLVLVHLVLTSDPLNPSSS